jgi:hypothetical protein
MNIEQYLIREGIEPWLAKFVMRRMAYNAKENKYIEPNNYLDKPIGGHEKKDIFGGDLNENRPK